MKEIKKMASLDDLLVSTFKFKDPQTARAAAENTLYPITRGIGAIGSMLWWASQHEDFPDDRTEVGDIGLLIKTLSEISQTMQAVAINAMYQISEESKGKDSEYIEIPVIGKAR